MSWIRSGYLVAVALVVGACSSDGGVGDVCDKSGSTDGCVSGAICSNSSTGTAYCRKTCVEQTDCAATESCNGVSGSNLKSCQPK